MFGIFKKRSGTAPFPAEQCSVDFSENGMTINGMKLDVLVHLDAAVKLLGNPRSEKYKTSAENREFLEGVHGNGMVTNRVNYTWDDIGIYCYTLNGKVVHCFGFKMSNNGDLHLKHDPEKLFSGTLTICGRPWQQVIALGEDCEVLRELRVGDYLITAEYADPFAGDNPEDGGYSCIEISLA